MALSLVPPGLPLEPSGLPLELQGLPNALDDHLEHSNALEDHLEPSDDLTEHLEHPNDLKYVEYPNTLSDIEMIDDLDDLNLADSSTNHTFYPALMLLLLITGLILLIPPTYPFPSLRMLLACIAPIPLLSLHRLFCFAC